MSTEPQPIPTPTSTSAPLPRPSVGAEAPAPGANLEQSPADAAQPGIQVPPEQVPGGPSAPAPAPPQTPPQTPPLKIKRTRISGVWVAVGFFALVLLLLLIFILQNGTTVQVSYMGAHGHLPLGVALLLSAVCGVLLVVLAGAARISQLRTVARRHRRADSRRAKAAERAAS
jgi:uncharacterized integral membrane protein